MMILVIISRSITDPDAIARQEVKLLILKIIIKLSFKLNIIKLKFEFVFVQQCARSILMRLTHVHGAGHILCVTYIYFNNYNII